MSISTASELRTLVGLNSNELDVQLDAYLAGLLTMFEDVAGLYFDDFGSEKTETFNKQVLCNSTYNIGAWTKITKVEIASFGSTAWTTLTEEIDFMFGNLKKHKQVIFEVKAIYPNSFGANTKLKITGTKGINITDATKLPNDILLLLAQCVQGYYNFQEAGGLVQSEEKSGNLTVKFENDMAKGGNALSTAQAINPTQIAQLKTLFESYKVNYNYPL
jgi:hypothetical protein